MTNNTQLVSVPRELLERINRVSFLPVAIASELGDILTCPAEDVRAVVDEPVAWEHKMLQEFGHIKELTDDPKHPFGVADVDYDASYTVVSDPLYRHPQRPVVMPVRQDPGPAFHQWPQGWNDCLDEFARLNK